MKTVTRSVVRIQLSRGLQNLDCNFDLLARLHEKLQLASLDVPNIDMDVLTFANYACDLSVIVKTVHSKKAEVWGIENNGSVEHELSSVKVSQSAIGFVYLVFPSDTNSKKNPSRTSELNMGIIIDSEHRRKGYARRAIKIYLNRAFKLYKCHRIQVAIANPLSLGMFPAYKAFIASGFKQEGIRRRAHYDHFESTWQDVAHLAMLDTEWMVRHGTPREKEVVTTWGEMVDRHQKEGDEMDKIENRWMVARERERINYEIGNADEEGICRMMADWHAEEMSDVGE